MSQNKGPVKFPKTTAKVVGDRIREARKSYKWTLQDLARVSGICRNTLSAYEYGSRLPVRDNLVRLSLALRRSMEFLLLGKYAKRTAQRE